MTSNSTFNRLCRYSLLLDPRRKYIRRHRVPPQWGWRGRRFDDSRHDATLKLVIKLDRCVGGCLCTMIYRRWSWRWDTETI